MSGMSERLRTLHAGETTFAAFYAATRPEWRRMALSICRRWSLPCGVMVEDVEQEMLLGAWRALGRWDPARASLVGFVVFSARSAASKWIHKQRGARRWDGHSPSEFPIAVSRLLRPGSHISPERMLERLAGGGSCASERLDFSRMLALVPGCATSERGRQVLAVLLDADGDERVAAAALFDDVVARLEYQLQSARHAVSVVRRERARLRALLVEEDDR